MAIKADLLAEIKARVDIVTLIGDYVPLRKTGRRFVGLCPFHQEKTPSFSVNAEGQFFYCFGCKASGDAIDFIMRIEGLDFLAAAKMLAERAGVQWLDQTPADAAREKRRDALLRVNTMAAEVFRRALQAPKTGAKAGKYLISRSFDNATAQHFQLGYAPASGRVLVDVFRRYGLRLEDAAAIGLVVPTADGYIDRFRDRLIFPLIDYRARVLGFGGRILGQGQPKYLNSPESEIFTKGRYLYGLNLARDAIRRQGLAVVVEGYFDVIRAHQMGISNVVATLGTALTEHHAGLLKRYATEVVIAYDGDSAGQAATIRGLEILRRSGLNVRVAVIPPEQDPDDFIRAEGPESFNSLVASSLPLAEYQLQRTVAGADLASPEGRAAAVRACLPVLAEIASASAREGYLHDISRLVHVSEDRIEADLRTFLHEQRKQRHIMDNDSSNTKRCSSSTVDSFLNPAEKELLRAVLKEYSLLTRIKEVLSVEDFAPGPLREIYRLILNQPQHCSGLDLINAIREDERLHQLLIQLLAETDGGEDGSPLVPEPVAKCLRRVKADAIRRGLLDIQAKIQDLQKEGGGSEQLAACLKQQDALRRQLDEYQDRSAFNRPE